MNGFTEFFRDITKKIRENPRQQPTAVRIARDHCDFGADQAEPFVPDDHYFQVRVNELFLRASRKWFKEIDPLVFVVSEFIYDDKICTMPFVVGPALVKRDGQETAAGTILRNTRVAGLHPYRGGRLALAVTLCQSVQKDHARTLLKVLESAAGALDYATMVAPYLKIGSVVLNGLEALLSSGDTVPLVALREELDINANDSVAPAYFALIDAPNVELAKLWVRDNRLLYGASLEKAQPFADADFVLYSLVRPAKGERNDLALLPFHEQWERVKIEASKGSEEAYKNAKANMLALYQTLLLSPDLTRSQANTLTDQWTAEMKSIHDRAVRFGQLGGAEKKESGLDAARKRALAAIEL